MEKSIFWSCQLSSECKSASWTPCEDEEDEKDDSLQIQQTLQLSHATLGDISDANKAVNVITVSWIDEDGTQTEPVPMCSLRSSTNMIRLNSMQSTAPVSFQLASGSGPVYIIGSHRMSAFVSEGFEDGDSLISNEAAEEYADVSDEDEDEDDDEESTTPPAKKHKKSVHFSEEKQIKTISVTTPANHAGISKKGKSNEVAVTKLLTAPLDGDLDDDYADEVEFGGDEDSSLLAPDSDEDGDDSEACDSDEDNSDEEEVKQMLSTSLHKSTPHPSANKQKSVFAKKTGGDQKPKGPPERAALFKEKAKSPTVGGGRYFNQNSSSKQQPTGSASKNKKNMGKN
jgi:hypothetical protein